LLKVDPEPHSFTPFPKVALDAAERVNPSREEMQGFHHFSFAKG